MVPNTFAYMVLYAWPVLAAVLFRAVPLNRAIISSALVGYLLLPSAVPIALVGLPDLGKNHVVMIGIIATYLGHRRPGLVSALPRTSVFVMAVALACCVLTTLTNSDALIKPDFPVPGLTMYDALGKTFENILTIAVVIIGAKALGHSEDHRQFLLLLGTAMLLYSVPILLELRISPQLHRWVYGLHPFSFDQQVRGGGYRANVFMPHGLTLAVFLASGTAALMALRRSPERIFGAGPRLGSFYLWIVLLFQKSLGALCIGSLMILALLLRPRKQVVLAAAVAAFFLAYPMIRGANAVPVNWINGIVAGYSAERSGSFETRLVNEDQLLAKANKRPWFGWGGWGRSRIYDQNTGADISITDGYWIIVFGFSGWVGYLSHFGLVCVPLLGLVRHRRQVSAETAGLALILAANLLDMIPNSSVTPLTWLIGGALTGATVVARRAKAISPVMVASPWSSAQRSLNAHARPSQPLKGSTCPTHRRSGAAA